MPVVSAKQERFMQAVAHNPKFAKKAGVPQSVGKEFMKKPKKFDAGGPAQMMGGAGGGAPLQKSFAPLQKMAAAGVTQGMGQGMQRPGGMGRMFGGGSRAAQMQKMRMAMGMRGPRQAGPQGMGPGQADTGMADFAAGAAGRTAASRQAQMDALIKSEGAKLAGMRSSPSGQSSPPGQMMQNPSSGQAAPTVAPPGQDFSGFSGVTGGKKGGKVSDAKIGKSKESKMKESKKMIGKELSFMKKKGAPKKMIKHEAAEMGAMKKGGKVAKYARGGGIEVKGKTRGKMC